MTLALDIQLEHNMMLNASAEDASAIFNRQLKITVFGWWISIKLTFVIARVSLRRHSRRRNDGRICDRATAKVHPCCSSEIQSTSGGDFGYRCNNDFANKL